MPRYRLHVGGENHRLLAGQKALNMSNKFLVFLTTVGKVVVHILEAAPKAAVIDGQATVRRVEDEILAFGCCSSTDRGITLPESSLLWT
jgi:hypothetical protein